MEITRRSKLFDVLNAYPFLEDQIVDIAPPFKNLRNPVLRRTVGQLATVERVAEIGNLDVVELVNRLRRAAGLTAVAVEGAPPLAGLIPAPSGGDPDWISGEPQFVVDGTGLLTDGEVPLQRVNELLGELAPGAFILLATDFEPSPIMDAMRLQSRRVYHKMHPDGSGQHLTYIGLAEAVRGVDSPASS